MIEVKDVEKINKINRNLKKNRQMPPTFSI